MNVKSWRKNFSSIFDVILPMVKVGLAASKVDSGWKRLFINQLIF
jgi:hypothetical protein